jgi:uncharacterized protein (TIGR03790 family)
MRVAALACIVGSAGLAHAEPDIFLVYSRNVPASRELAEYYMKQRGVPAAQSIGLDLPSDDEISRDAYVAEVRVPLRAWLRHENLQDKIKCIVTFYGVPLRVAGTGVTREDRTPLEEINAELDAAAAELEGLNAALETFASQSQPASRPAGRPDVTKLLEQYKALRARAAERLAAARTPQENLALTQSLGDIVRRAEGMEAIVSHVQGQDPAGRQKVATLQAEVAGRREQLKHLLVDCPRTPHRREAHALLRELYGVGGLIAHLQEDKANLEGKETQAALDSELSLLWWDDYPLYRWVWNPMCWRVRHDERLTQHLDPDQMARSVVMVARLDAPTPQIVRRMMDDAMAVEAAGLAGIVYVDARGMPAADNGYGEYDEDLRQMARLLEKTGLPLVLDNKPELFQPGQCPDAALYCGWYSLGKYIDAFKWVRGSVAWHIASSEAVSLHNLTARYWCKRMLEEGVTATLGPVAEPYLQSFPRPRDFFGLLLTGRYTLAEVYWHTCPMCSWMQTLLGDPLYNPYRKHPLLKVEDVVPEAWLKEPPVSQPAAKKVASGD